MTDLHERTLATLDVRPVTGFIGAEIHGVDISRPLDDATVAAIRAALLRWKVVFFRDQRLDHASQVAFTKRFGEITYAHPHEDAHADGYPEVYPIHSQRHVRRNGPDFSKATQRHAPRPFDGWHADVTAAVNPPWGSILRAVVVPPYGGDTMWTDLVQAYENLSEPVKELVDGLRAEHRFGVGYVPVGEDDSYERLLENNPLVSIHPVVRVHPETGRKVLAVNPSFTSHILDVSPRESATLLELLFEEIARPDHTVRFRWTPGSVAFWDNRACAHRGPGDLAPGTERLLFRTTLVGDIPVGPDGRRSEVVAGRPFGHETRVRLG